MKPSSLGFVLPVLQSILLAATLMILSVNYIPAQIFQWPPKILLTLLASELYPLFNANCPPTTPGRLSFPNPPNHFQICSLYLENSSLPNPNASPSSILL